MGSHPSGIPLLAWRFGGDPRAGMAPVPWTGPSHPGGQSRGQGQEDWKVRGWSQAASLPLSHGAPRELCEQFKNKRPRQPAHPAWALACRVFSSSLKKHFLSLSICQGKKLRAKGRQSGLGREPASRIIIFQ